MVQESIDWWLRSARLFQCKALQRRQVQEALIYSDDRNARYVAVMQNQARWRYGARELKRQNNAKRFAGPDHVGNRAGPVARVSAAAPGW